MLGRNRSAAAYHTDFVEIKCQLDATDVFFIAEIIACSTCFGHHYAHHQELKSIIQVVAACGIWCFGKPDTQPTALHQTDNLKTKAPNTTGSNHLYNTLELLMMGIMVPETC